MGFKHSEASIELMRASKLGRNRTEDAKLKITASNTQAHNVIVTNNNTGNNTEFIYLRKTTIFIDNHSYIAKCLKNYGLYKNEKYS
jgi:hypothetical protein